MEDGQNNTQLEKIGWDFSLDRMGRTLDSITGLISNVTSGLSGVTSSVAGGNCPNAPMQQMENLIIPLFVIIPAIIIGVAIAIKKIGFFIAWIPKFTGPFFEAFRGNQDSEESGGGGWSSPSPMYGPPSGYGYGGSSGGGGGNSLSRQTVILNAIDDLNNQYGQPQLGQGQGPSVADGVADQAQAQYQWQNGQNQNQNQNQPNYYSGVGAASQPLAAQMSSNINYRVK